MEFIKEEKLKKLNNIQKATKEQDELNKNF